MMDHEVADWLAELIQQTTSSLEHNPGLTIEVDDDPANWVQVIPASVDGKLSGFILNLPFKVATDEPLAYLREAGVELPPNTVVSSWEPERFITLLVSPQISLTTLATHIGDLLLKIGHAAADFEINVQVLHGL